MASCGAAGNRRPFPFTPRLRCGQPATRRRARATMTWPAVDSDTDIGIPSVPPGRVADGQMRRQPHELRATGATAGRPRPLRGRTHFTSRTFVNNGP